MDKPFFTMMSAYNQWANASLYDAVARLSPEEFTRDVSAFFRSMRGTLNHLLVTDLIWMQRFTSQGEAPRELNAILHGTFPDLRAAREAQDRRIIDWIAALDDRAFAGNFTYVPVTNPRQVTQRLAPALVHLFNHQTHHRGQAHMILSVLGKNPPPLDLIYYQRSSAGSRFA